MEKTKEKHYNNANHRNVNTRRKNNKKSQSRGKGKTARKVILAIVFVLLVFFVIRMTENGWTYGGFLATIMGHNSKTVDRLEPIYVVVTGESQGLTDSIMLCKYDPKANNAYIISIPRDTFVGDNQNRATANDKINTLYERSPEKLLQEINEITGLNVKYYVNIDTKGLRELIDSIGGVKFNVPIDMDYDDPTKDLHIHLKAGEQVLDGNKAEQVVRFRHNNDSSSYPSEYGDNDIGRMRTQREFISTLVNQLLQKKSISKISEYVKIAKRNVKTNFNFDDIKDYIPYMVDFKTENMETKTLPGEPKLCNGVWLYIPNHSKVQELITEIK